MKPEDVPDEMVEQANEAWRTAPQKRDGQPTRMRHALAAAWPAIEATARAEVAAEFRARADRIAADWSDSLPNALWDACTHDPQAPTICDDPRTVAAAALRHLADRLDAKE